MKNIKIVNGKVYYYNQEELTRYCYKFSELSKKIETKLNEVYKELKKTNNKDELG